MAEELINITVDSRRIAVRKGTTILQACRQAGIEVPTLCHLEEVSTNASCGICVVEVKGSKRLVRSCTYACWPDMEIQTNTERIRKARKTNLELVLANHPLDCLNCDRNGNCELQSLAYQLGVRTTRFPRTRKAEIPLDVSSLSLVRDPNKCILCGRCVAVCAEMQTVHAIDFTGRGLNSKVTTFLDKGLGNVACTNCGQCALVCPTGAIVEKSDVEAVWAALADPDLTVVVQTAPAIRVGIGEAMGLAEGALVTGQMVAGLRRLGFKRVFDTQFTADLTIIEEGHELIRRISTGGTLPMITSCSPVGSSSSSISIQVNSIIFQPVRPSRCSELWQRHSMPNGPASIPASCGSCRSCPARPRSMKQAGWRWMEPSTTGRRTCI
jgi:NADH dehydrogenase/NADH:ubiquinone oxidoreductase subunit G